MGMDVGVMLGFMVGVVDGEGEGREEGKMLGDALGILEMDGDALGCIPFGTTNSKQNSQVFAHRSLIKKPSRSLPQNFVLLCFLSPTQVQLRVTPEFMVKLKAESSSQHSPQE